MFRGLQGDQGAEYSGQEPSQTYGQIPGNTGYQMPQGQMVDQNQGYYNTEDGNRAKKRKIRSSLSRDSSENNRHRKRRERSPSVSSDVG